VKRTVHFERLPTVSAPGPGVDEPPTKSTPILSVPFHGTVTITNAKRQDDNSIMCYTATFRVFFLLQDHRVPLTPRSAWQRERTP
jgi:hypothetical protein